MPIDFKSLRVGVKVDGEYLPHFQPEVDEGSNTISCWIPSEAGKAYIICCEGSVQLNFSLRGKLFVDGKSSYVAHMISDEGDPYAKLQINFYRRSEEEVQDLRFAPLVGVDDDALLHVKSLDTPGVIRLETYRARNLGRNHQSFKRSVNEGEVVPNDRVHERGKKAMSHITQLGPVRRVKGLGVVSCEPYTPTDHSPWAVFVFKYRPAGILQAQGIMPPPEPEKSPSPEDLEEGTQSVEDLREIQEKKAKLADRLRAIKAEQEELDLRETLALSQASGAKVKQEDASQSTKRRPFGQAKQPEVIDLTLDD